MLNGLRAAENVTIANCCVSGSDDVGVVSNATFRKFPPGARVRESAQRADFFPTKTPVGSRPVFSCHDVSAFRALACQGIKKLGSQIASAQSRKI